MRHSATPEYLFRSFSSARLHTHTHGPFVPHLFARCRRANRLQPAGPKSSLCGPGRAWKVGGAANSCMSSAAEVRGEPSSVRSRRFLSSDPPGPGGSGAWPLLGFVSELATLPGLAVLCPGVTLSTRCYIRSSKTCCAPQFITDCSPQCCSWTSAEASSEGGLALPQDVSLFSRRCSYSRRFNVSSQVILHSSSMPSLSAPCWGS